MQNQWTARRGREIRFPSYLEHSKSQGTSNRASNLTDLRVPVLYFLHVFDRKLSPEQPPMIEAGGDLHSEPEAILAPRARLMTIRWGRGGIYKFGMFTATMELLQ